MFDTLDESELLDVMRGAQRRERVAIAERLLAAGRLCQLRIRLSHTDNREQWCIDNWEAVAAEVGAELGISRGRASSQMNYGIELLERLPRLAAVFAAGEVDFRVIVAAVFRTGLITDPDIMAAVDQRLARNAPGWNRLSRDKIAEIVDWYIRAVDPDAVRAERSADTDRHVEVGPSRHGLAEFWGSVRAPDAAVLDRRLDELAAMVCPDDPRTARQRRADALGALAAGSPALACACGSERCPVRADSGTTTGQIVIHLVAEARTVTGDGSQPGLLPGYGAVPPDRVRDLAIRARLRPVAGGAQLRAEPHYRPSAALADFIRCRDLTCRFPGCDRPAEIADIDHTVPYPLGPTHPSNLKLLCRAHHLVKTFYAGSDGWSDKQLPDGRVIWTSPTGRTYTTKPAGALFFPQFAVPTETLILPGPLLAAPPSGPQRGVMMPTRRRTRAQDRVTRISWERGRNRAKAAADPPPF